MIFLCTYLNSSAFYNIFSPLSCWEREWWSSFDGYLSLSLGQPVTTAQGPSHWGCTVLQVPILPVVEHWPRCFGILHEVLAHGLRKIGTSFSYLPLQCSAMQNTSTRDTTGDPLQRGAHPGKWGTLLQMCEVIVLTFMIYSRENDGENKQESRIHPPVW